MILYALRHGQTDLNRDHILQGNSIDEPLNDVGLTEIKEVLKLLPDFEVIISSSHKRAVESAEIIGTFSGKQVVVSPYIQERDFGTLVGKKWVEISNGQKLREIDRELEYDYSPYGGESVQDVTERLYKFLSELKEINKEKVLVVTSRGIIQLLYKIIENKKVIDIDNATVHTFNIPD